MKFPIAGSSSLEGLIRLLQAGLTRLSFSDNFIVDIKKDIEIDVTPTVIPHNLGKIPEFFIVGDINSPSVISSNKVDNPWTDKNITLISNNKTKATILIF